MLIPVKILHMPVEREIGIKIKFLRGGEVDQIGVVGFLDAYEVVKLNWAGLGR